MDPQIIAYAYVGSLLTSLLLVAAAWRWPNLGRLLYALMFIWAAQYNLRTAFVRPEEYLGFAQYAYLPAYRAFILGPFAQHITPIVATIALGQLAIALLLLGTTRAARVGMAGGIVFLVAIAPLGTAAAFPSTLVMALGVALLWRVAFGRSLPRLLRDRFVRLSAPPD